MTTLNCNAIIFDMDGTLINTNDCIEKVWHNWGRKYNVVINEVPHGCTAFETIKLIAPHIDAEKAAIDMEKMVFNEIENVKLIPGVKEFINKLPRGSWTIATSASYELAVANLQQVGIPVPKAMITAESVTNGKPHPEPFIKAAELLKTPTNKCIVFEDSLMGVKSAYNAGAKVIGITTTHSKDELDLASTTINDFRDIEIKISNKRCNTISLIV